MPINTNPCISWDWSCRANKHKYPVNHIKLIGHKAVMPINTNPCISWDWSCHANKHKYPVNHFKLIGQMRLESNPHILIANSPMSIAVRPVNIRHQIHQ